MQKTTLFVGLLDKDTRKQEIATSEAYDLAGNIFCATTGGATIYEAKGVYTHNDGSVIQENTLVCIIYGSEKETILKAADLLKAALNQESIAIETVESPSEFY